MARTSVLSRARRIAAAAIAGQSLASASARSEEDHQDAHQADRRPEQVRASASSSWTRPRS